MNGTTFQSDDTRQEAMFSEMERVVREEAAEFAKRLIPIVHDMVMMRIMRHGRIAPDHPFSTSDVRAWVREEQLKLFGILHAARFDCDVDGPALRGLNGEAARTIVFQEEELKVAYPLAAIGTQVKEGGKHGRAIAGDTSKRKPIRDEWKRIEEKEPGLPITATRKRIVNAGIASMRAIVKATKDLAAELKKKKKKRR